VSGLSYIAAQFAECRMRDNQLQGLFEEGFAGLDAVPGGCAGGMGQGNQIKLVSCVGDAEFFADDGVEFLERHELFDGEFTDGQDKLRLEDFDFAFQPRGAIADFIGRGNAVAAGGFFAGKAAADGRHVDRGAEGLFGHGGGFLKPAEQGFAGSPGEGAAEDRFLVAGSLADEENLAVDRAAADDGLVHLRAEAAGAETLDVLLEKQIGCFRFCVRCHTLSKSIFPFLQRMITMRHGPRTIATAGETGIASGAPGTSIRSIEPGGAGTEPAVDAVASAPAEGFTDGGGHRVGANQIDEREAAALSVRGNVQ
jgi:hypothetical protein